MKEDKKVPLLDKDKKKEQNIKKQDDSREPNSKLDKPEKPTKENPEKVPESNDPAGYSDRGNAKETPSGQRDKK